MNFFLPQATVKHTIDGDKRHYLRMAGRYIKYVATENYFTIFLLNFLILTFLRSFLILRTCQIFNEQ